MTHYNVPRGTVIEYKLSSLLKMYVQTKTKLLCSQTNITPKYIIHFEFLKYLNLFKGLETITRTFGTHLVSDIPATENASEKLEGSKGTGRQTEEHQSTWTST